MKKLLLLLSVLLAGVSGAWAQPDVTGKTFTLQCARGYVYYNGTRLAGTNTEANASEFAFISNCGQTYLYDVTNRKFVCHTTAATAGGSGNNALENNETDLSKIAKGFRFGNTEIAAYPYYLEETEFGNWLNMDGTPLVYLNTWKDFEGGAGGNTYKVNILNNDFDQSGVINYFWNKWYIVSSDLSANLWTAMGGSTPSAVTEIGSQASNQPYAAYSRTQEFTLTENSIVKVSFLYSTGLHKLEILGVDLLDNKDKVVGSDYHFGSTGGQHSNNTYTIENVPAGSYKLRYIINGTGTSNSAGNITVSTIKYNAWNITSSDVTTDSWTAMGEGTPAGITALGSYTPYSRTQNITLTNEGYLEFIFHWNTGGDRLEMLGVDLLDGEDNVVASDYHYGKAGNPSSNQTYLLSGLTAGSYKLRYIIHKDGNLDDSQGVIKVNNIKVASSFATISQWYVLRAHTNSGYYMYYDSEATYKYGFTQSSADINTNSYLWGFVKSGDGVQIYNKAAGNTIALDDNNPSTVSDAGVAADFAFTVGRGTLGDLGEAADAVFTLTHTSGNALNYNSGNKRLQQWSGNDAGSAFVIYEAEAPTTISYTLTDVNGATYSGTYTGMASVTEPPITGCYDYSLSNKAWDGTTFTADIIFPFPVSSGGKTNPTFIQSSLGTSLWYAKNGNVIADNDANTPQTFYDTFANNYLWYIYPVFSENGFVFSLYNVGAKKYIPKNPSTAHNTATSLTETMLNVGGFQWAHYNKGNGFYDVATSKFLTINTSGTAQNIWLWSAPSGTGHMGSVMSFPSKTIINVGETFAAMKDATKLDILDGSTVKAPNEFSNTPAEINAAIDAAQEVADNSEAKIEFIESENATIIQNYLDLVATYGALANIQFTMSKEYGTLILPCPCARIDGLDIYSCNNAEGNVLILTPINGNYAQNVPYIIHATEGSKYTIIGWDKGSTATHTAGWLTGVLNSTTEIPSGSYMLATKKDTNYQAFYQVSGTGVLCAINKCYLTVPSGGDVKAFLFDIDGRETSIEEIFDEKTEQGAIFNLAGQRMSRIQKGVNIVNGKKVLVK